MSKEGRKKTLLYLVVNATANVIEHIKLCCLLVALIDLNP